MVRTMIRTIIWILTIIRTMIRTIIWIMTRTMIRIGQGQ